jgi:hypothetical protein
MTTRTLTLNVVLSLLLWSLLVALFLILSPVFAHAQGCPAEPIGSVTVNPTKIRAELPEQTALLLDGTPAVTGYTFGWFAEGASAPTTSTPIAKTAFTLVAGTTLCYEAPLPALTGIPLGQKYIGVLKTLRGTMESAWSAPSNPFGFEGPVQPPAAVRIRK